MFPVRYELNLYMLCRRKYRSRGRVLFPALSDFLRSSGSGTASTQPREYN
jgi:hypothetical protein